jgi:hypothetical protein
MKIKFRVIKEDNDEYVILVEDGGVAATHHNGMNLVTTYYQNRITRETDPDGIWDELAEGKAYIRDWPFTEVGPPELEMIIQDALDWLVVSPDKQITFVPDEKIWTEIL